jgi:hypothetical protein
MGRDAREVADATRRNAAAVFGAPAPDLARVVVG